MKGVFDGYSKSEWRFVKFHIVLHCPEQIRQYGSLLIMDAGRWEETHAHFAKVGEQQQSSSRTAAETLRFISLLVWYPLVVCSCAC